MTARALVQLALAHAERGDAAGAAGILRASLDLPDEHEARELPHAESFAAFGRRVGLSGRSVRALVKRRGLPTMGSGSGKRVIVAEALAALRTTSSAETAGRAHVERRRLHAVGGEATSSVQTPANGVAATSLFAPGTPKGAA